MHRGLQIGRVCQFVIIAKDTICVAYFITRE